MSRTVALKPPPNFPPRNDPFRYRWRYVLRQIEANGNEVWDQIPLTLDDVLHPEEDDFHGQGTAHAREKIETRVAEFTERCQALEEQLKQSHPPQRPTPP